MTWIPAQNSGRVQFIEITGMLAWSGGQVNSISAQAGAAKTWLDGQGCGWLTALK
jgi:hypothetical protein